MLFLKKTSQQFSGFESGKKIAPADFNTIL